jgi:hypothetical protein
MISVSGLIDVDFFGLIYLNWGLIELDFLWLNEFGLEF